MKEIKLTRNTIINGLGVVEMGTKLKVGERKDISEKDAIYLVNIKKAVVVGDKAPARKETAESKVAENTENSGEDDEINPLITRAMLMADVETVDELAAMSDEELLDINGIGETMLKAIRKALEE